MSKVTFYGLPAWVGAIRSPTVAEWWDRDPVQLNFDRSLLHTVDLAKSPSAALAGHIQASQIEADEHTKNGGLTTIGPLWPAGTMIGALWVSNGYLAKNGMSPPGVPPGFTAHDYEFTVVQYFDGEQGNRRFHGFHANVLQHQSNLSLVEIWHPGTGAGSVKPAGTWWLDLRADTDPNAPRLAINHPGPLYLDTSPASRLLLFSPKIPPFVGTFPFPTSAIDVALAS